MAGAMCFGAAVLARFITPTPRALDDEEV